MERRLNYRHEGKKVKEKPKNIKKTLIRFMPYLKNKYKILFSVFLLVFLSSMLTVIGPYLIGNITNKTFELIKDDSKTYLYNEIVVMILFLASAYAVMAIATGLEKYITSNTSQKIINGLRIEVEKKLGRLPMEFYQKNQTGDIISRIINDTDNIFQAIQQSLVRLFEGFISVTGIAGMMLYISLKLGLLSFVLLFMSIKIIRFLAIKSGENYKLNQKNLGKLNNFVEESISNPEMNIAYGLKNKFLKKFDNFNESLTKSWEKAMFYGQMPFSALLFLNNLNYVVIAVVGGIDVARGKLNVGALQAFILYEKNLSQPFRNISETVNTIMSGIAGAERIFEILDAEEEIDSGEEIDLSEIKGEIEFKNVYFSYGSKEVLKDVSFKIKSGEKAAIVGPTGSGKSTLVNVLTGFYTPVSGKIYIDGKDISEIKKSNLRMFFSRVSQDGFIFSGSVYENIAYSNTYENLEKVVEAAELSQASTFIRGMEKGYESIIDEDMSYISEGQKQLLFISRAIFAKRPIVILDEATSNVDTATEELIQKGLNEVIENRTAIIIAHRLSTIVDCDRIFVMDEGSIAEEGTHEELLKKDGLYKKIYESAFS